MADTTDTTSNVQTIFDLAAPMVERDRTIGMLFTSAQWDWEDALAAKHAWVKEATDMPSAEEDPVASILDMAMRSAAVAADFHAKLAKALRSTRQLARELRERGITVPLESVLDFVNHTAAPLPDALPEPTV